MGNTLIFYTPNKGENCGYMLGLRWAATPIVQVQQWKGAMFYSFATPGRAVRSAWALAMLFSMSLGCLAQNNEGRPEYLQATQRWLDDAVINARASEASPLRMEVLVGELDSRLRLAPCDKVEPHIPAGTRLWGKTRLGLRCLAGATRWNVFLPVTIKAWGPAWVIRGDVPPGTVLSEDDAMEAEVDWAEERNPILATPAQWVGQVASRTLITGQALRQGMTRPAQVFQAGVQIRVLAQGPGFQITSDGQALSAGVVGQLARVRMDNGRVMSGVVLDGRTVKLEL